MTVMNEEPDHLTGLPGHTLYRRLLEGHAGQPARLIMLDIRCFMYINHNHGHMKGDEVLVNVANALRPFANDNTHVIWLGADDFMVMSFSPDDGTLLSRVLQAAVEVRAPTGERLVFASAEAVGPLNVDLVRQVDDARYTMAAQIRNVPYARRPTH